MTPAEALDRLLFRILMRTRKFGGPGAVVASMSAEVREALKDLRSKDTLNVRDEEARAWIVK